MSRPPTKIAVAMSGGVDSSVAAHRLVSEGEDVFGIMLRLWSAGPELQNRCCSPRDLVNARRIAADLDIPFFVLDVKERFKSEVVDYFLDGYAQGFTPNPCIACNRNIRWGYMLDRATALGATHLATGHYARVEQNEDEFILRRAADPSKDQSYVLHVLTQAQLSKAFFPIGGLAKSEVRAYAQQHKLAVADREESQDLCFLGGMDYREFLQDQRIALLNPGPIIDAHGEKIGNHTGLARFTIGQRKGIEIPADEPYYVIAKDAEHNALIVGHRHESGRNRFNVTHLNWILGRPPAVDEQLHVQIRYRSTPVPAHIARSDADSVEVHLSRSLRDITPGQWAVFYSKETCLGGGMIAE